MNPRHLAAFVWLRHRLMVNQLRRGGLGNRIILGIAAASGVMLVVGLFAGGLSAGFFGLPELPAVGRLLVWDVLVAAYTFFRLLGLVGELQRTDGITPAKYLHLPVSPAGAFLVNYASAALSLSLAFFGSAAVGLTLGHALSGAPLVLLTLPLMAAFAFAATALTDLASSWIAALASTPRRRRTVAAVATLAVVGLAQAPGISMAAGLWKPAGKDGSWLADRNAAEEVARLANLALPPGWLALGAADLADGLPLPALLAGLGYTLVGVGALRLSYRATLRLMRDPASGGESAAKATDDGKPGGVRFAERQLPWVPEPAAAVALATLRSVWRQPQAKAALIAPVVMLAFFAFGVLRPAARSNSLPVEVRPLIAFGAVALLLATTTQLVGNQFGYDRSGFRAYVLSPASRRDTLLGKNLATAPFGLVLAAVALLAVEVALPVRPDHLLMLAALIPALHLLFCLPCNLTSVLAPIALPVPGGRPPQFRTLPVLAHMSMLGVLPLVAVPLVLPLGVEYLLAWLLDVAVLPVALPLTLVLLAGVAALYRAVLPLEGRLLASREQAVLAAVVATSE